jgi:Lrp/AsnC family transcriptional regulator, regulator for asnA, asnC and gidA
MDPIDARIVKILQADSRKPFVEIATQIGLSESAVRRRVKNLTRRAIIKKFTVEISSGDTTSAITLISVNSTSDRFPENLWNSLEWKSYMKSLGSTI